MIKKLAKVEKVFFGLADPGVLTMRIHLDYGKRSQVFGRMGLNGRWGTDYMVRLLKLFKVNTLDEMVGRTVFALFEGDTEDLSNTIKGLQMPDFDGGGCFITRGWEKEHWDIEQQEKKKLEEMKKCN